MYSRVCDHVDKLARHEMGSRQSSPYSSKHTQTRVCRAEEHTDWYMRIRCDGELFHQAFGRYTSLVEMAQHLSRRRLSGPVRGGDLHSMILRLVLPGGGNISSHLTIFELPYMRTATRARKVELRTWRTVTGKRAPCWSHIAVMPRFRAMTPVRTEFGVHFAAAEVDDSAASAFVTTVW